MSAFSSLGFVENDRLHVQRDNGYIGASNNPSKKEFSNIIQPAQTPPSAAAAGSNPSHQQQQQQKQRQQKLPPVASKAHPSSMSPPPALVSPPDETGILQRRILFLEAQDKRRMSEISELRGQLSDARSGFEERVQVQGTVLLDEGTPYSSSLGEEEEEGSGSGESKISGSLPKGQVVKLYYPMRKSVHDGGVHMRHILVDPQTAALRLVWVLVQDAEGRKRVGSFTD